MPYFHKTNKTGIEKTDDVNTPLIIASEPITNPKLIQRIDNAISILRRKKSGNRLSTALSIMFMMISHATLLASFIMLLYYRSNRERRIELINESLKHKQDQLRFRWFNEKLNPVYHSSYFKRDIYFCGASLQPDGKYNKGIYSDDIAELCHDKSPDLAIPPWDPDPGISAAWKACYPILREFCDIRFQDKPSHDFNFSMALCVIGTIFIIGLDIYVLRDLYKQSNNHWRNNLKGEDLTKVNSICEELNIQPSRPETNINKLLDMLVGIRDEKIKKQEQRIAFLMGEMKNLVEHGAPILHFFTRDPNKDVTSLIFEYADLLPPTTRENKNKV